MIAAVSLILVLLFGLLVALLCAFGLYAPERMMKFVIGFWHKPNGLMIAVLVRAVMGMSLIFAAAGSRFPTAFIVLGVITLLAAAGILLAGRERIDRLVAWGAEIPVAVLRLWLGLGLLFGLFLLYSVSG